MIKFPPVKSKDRGQQDSVMGEDSVSVCELFAGVGGFRLGLEGPPSLDWESEMLKFTNSGYEIIWSNQWEPPSKRQKSPPKQWASMIYEQRFGSEHHVNQNIELVIDEVPSHDLLVGGFPCQDYSVARTISGELGIDGEKGKLWTSIHSIISKKQPKMILLENVSRLLTSPAKQKGLNFGKIGADLANLGYDFEWRVINAADYGMPQRRKRVFVIGYRKDLNLLPPLHRQQNAISWLTRKSPFAKKFPVLPIKKISKTNWPDVKNLDDKEFTKSSKHFLKAGICTKLKNGRIIYYSADLEVVKEEKNPMRAHLLKSDDSMYNPDYQVSDRLEHWDYVKGKRKEYRIRKKDKEWAESILIKRGKHTNLWNLYRHYMDKITRWKKLTKNHKAIFEKNIGTNHGVYRYNEGKIGRDDVSKPSRTVVTAEIGRSPSRSRHLFEYEGIIRRLQPIECERLNQFPDQWTKIFDKKNKPIPDSKRGFMMGNALVIGIIHRLREPIKELLQSKGTSK